MMIQYESFGSLWVHPDYTEVLKKNALCDFDALMTAPGQTDLRKKGLAGWRERIVLQFDTAQGAKKFYLKRYSHPPLKHQINRILHSYRSTAEIERHWMQELCALGISVPLPVAYGTRQRGLQEIQSLILLEKIPGQSLEKWLPLQLGENRLNPEMKSRLLGALADLVCRLHDAGLVHRDLYLSHIFIHQDSNGEIKLSLIDLQRVFKPGWRRRRWVVKDLAALNYSTSLAGASQRERLRWLKQYLGRSKLSSDDKALIREVTAKTERIRRHSHKHALG